MYTARTYYNVEIVKEINNGSDTTIEDKQDDDISVIDAVNKNNIGTYKFDAIYNNNTVSLSDTVKK